MNPNKHLADSPNIANPLQTTENMPISPQVDAMQSEPSLNMVQTPIQSYTQDVPNQLHTSLVTTIKVSCANTLLTGFCFYHLIQSLVLPPSAATREAAFLLYFFIPCTAISFGLICFIANKLRKAHLAMVSKADSVYKLGYVGIVINLLPILLCLIFLWNFIALG